MIENEEDTNIAENISNYIKEHSIDTKIVKDREILHETEDFRLTNFVNPNAESENDHSIMTLLEANGKRAVFMGDCRAKMIDIIPFEEFDIIKIGQKLIIPTADISNAAALLSDKPAYRHSRLIYNL